jgi:nucleoside-diphosphate-sugar epimerase
MKKVFITGEKGFIGTNLAKRAKMHGLEFISGDHTLNEDAAYVSQWTTEKREPCVHRNSEDAWQKFFEVNDIDIVIHNAAVVGTDVVALNSRESTLTNVQGTFNICRAAKKCNIPVCYMGTTVIYATEKYQQQPIIEDSDRGPHTFYGCQKLSAEEVVKSHSDKWMIIRPLFAYGGEGDMNSLIAKTIYAKLNGIPKVQMFLDPTKIKDYLHVNDYCDGVFSCIKADNCWNNDFNISAETPLVTGEIITLMDKVCGQNFADSIEWFPQTEYMGNHILSGKKVREYTGWSPRISLEQGIRMSFESILKSEGYNPLCHLEEAEERGVDLTEYF